MGTIILYRQSALGREFFFCIGMDYMETGVSYEFEEWMCNMYVNLLYENGVDLCTNGKVFLVWYETHSKFRIFQRENVRESGLLSSGGGVCVCGCVWVLRKSLI